MLPWLYVLKVVYKRFGGCNQSRITVMHNAFTDYNCYYRLSTVTSNKLSVVKSVCVIIE